MKRLWVAVAMAPLMYAAAAHGQTTISSSTTTPVATSTTGDLAISSSGTISPTTGGVAGTPVVAVTINSSNNVTNSGAIGFSTGLNYTTAILGLGGNTSTILNAGNITLTEASGYTDANKDGIADTNSGVIGQFSAGQNRIGIDIGGAGTFTGSITNSGGLTVVGDNSVGILVSTTFNGAFANTGTISVTGGNYYDLTVPANRDATTSYGIHATAPIIGAVSLSGNITATGHNVVGVAFDQAVTGQVEVFGTITASGYRSLTAPTDTALLTILYNGTPTSASELMQGGPALHIGGGVSGGVSIDPAVVAVAASGSTPAVAGVNAGTVYSYGSAPAILIDGSGTIGQYKTSGYGLILGGNVAGLGTYAFDDHGNPVSTTGVLIGGSATVAKGIDITGTVSGSSVSTGTGGLTADAAGLHLTGTASTPEVDVGYTGALAAASQATNAPNVVALKVDSTASVTGIINDGRMTASITGYSNTTNGVPNAASGGTAGYATVIQDNGGHLASIDNRGVITAGFGPGVSGSTITGSTIALDLRAGTVPITVTQEQITTANSATFNAANSLAVTQTGTALTAPTPSIAGDILFGSGNATLSVQAGVINGGISFGTGANILNIGTAGASVVNTTADPLEVKAAIVNAGTLAVDVTNGTLYTTNNLGVAVGRTADNSAGTSGSALTNPVQLSTLHVGATGALIFTANPLTGLNDQFNVAGQVTLDTGAKIGLALSSKIAGPATFTVITAGNVTGVASQTLLGSVPYFYAGQINTTTGPGGSVSISLAPKTAAEAGLNPAETAAFSAIYADFDKETATGDALLAKTTKADFIKLYDQFMPDYAGGPFETMMIGQQALERAESEGPMKLRSDESRGWVQEISYQNNRNTSSSVNGYNGSGFGAAAGFEEANEDGAVGVAGAFMTNAVHDSTQVPDSTLSASVIEAGVYWRSTGPGLNASANVNAGWAFFESHRFIIDQANDTTAATLIRGAKSSWNGGLVSAQIELNYPVNIGRFYLRPELSADYVALYETAHAERDGGTAVDLSIASKTSQEGSVQGDMVMGMTFGDTVKWRPEMTLGWREIIFGGPSNTSAHFNGGNNFVLSPQFTEKGGLLARLGVRAGGAFADFSADAGGVFRNGYETYDARAVARFLF
jgi:hypothetical protein